MTKHQDELLKYPLDNIETTEIPLIPQLTDDNLHICAPINLHLSQDNNINIIQPKKQQLKTKTTKTPLQKATSKLYNIENHSAPEKTLNIDLDLYQMEDC